MVNQVVISWFKRLTPIFIVLLFAGALWLLHHELRNYHYREVVTSIREIRGWKLGLALGCMVLSYGVLTGYDWFALRYLRKPLDYGRTALASFTGYVLSYNIGLSMLGGTAIRYRLYTAWGFSAGEIARLIGFCALTFWLGLFFMAGSVFISGAVVAPSVGWFPFSSLRPPGYLFLGLVACYLALTYWCRKPIALKGWVFELPQFQLGLTQLALGSLDLLLVSSILYVLLPTGAPAYPAFLGLYLLALTAGMISHVPGGLGVFETVILFGMPPGISQTALLGSLLAYRVIYYLVPLGLALILLAGHELIHRKDQVKQVADGVGRWLPEIAPRLIGFTTFLGGIILLLSGATPSVHGRLAWLNDFLPLPILEISHLLGSIIGVMLLFLARGLQRRMDGAYWVTLAMLGGGAVFSVLKGADFEEATALLLMMFLILPCRRFFYRKTSLIAQPFTTGWIVAIVLALVATFWVGLFSYKHVAYSDQLWWQFALRGDAPRFLRATLAIIASIAVIGVARLLRPGFQTAAKPTPEEFEKAIVLAAASPVTSANLIASGDKSILLNSEATAFLMYGREGRSWVVMGDPVGPEAEVETLIWQFRELCDQYGGWAAFYQVSTRNLPIYLDAGLALTKLGEQARVPLSGFSLEGGHRKGLRQTHRKLEKEGCHFEMIPKEAVPALLPDLKRVSDDWLTSKHTREKGFSLGFFAEDYLRRFPVGIVRRGDQIVAFANCWPGAGKHELSIDLMRYSRDAPQSVMEYLFIQLMLWGSSEGYEWFDLGLAPLSGMENRTMAPVWQRVGALIFRHGDPFYNFQGLRAYKEKFDPVWEPKYLAAPGGMFLPGILANIATLISGGAKGLISK